jgi:Kyakuja-Dileera-Zisupton transposase
LGIGAAACARHGCFCPGSVVDFHNGERQMNMDWVFIAILLTLNLAYITDILLIYDVMCQYHIHLYDRVAKAANLTIPDILKIIKAIGLFHVHGHQESCLYRFATTYIPGVGWVDGEILETLWAILNGISRSTRSATLAHRTEILDDHMGDSNWKKMIYIGSVNFIYIFLIFLSLYDYFTADTVSKKYKRAVVEQAETKDYFDGLSAAAPRHHVEQWKKEIEKAENERQSNLKSMDIMKSRINKGVKFYIL